MKKCDYCVHYNPMEDLCASYPSQSTCEKATEIFIKIKLMLAAKAESNYDEE